MHKKNILSNTSNNYMSGFTVVELIVAIFIIGILVLITLIGYGSWRSTAIATQLKSDLTSAVSAMKSYRNFNDDYPDNILDVYTPRDDITLNGGLIGTDGDYCISATNGAQSYFITSKISSPVAGVCPILYLEARPIAAPYPAPQDPLIDLSGNGRDAILLNSDGYSELGNGSFRFDGADDTVTTAEPQSFGSNTTWSAWVNCSQRMNDYNMFMGRHLPYFGFYAGNRIIFSHAIGAQRWLITSEKVSLNTWYFLVFSTEYDGINTVMKIYINGNLSIASSPYPGMPTTSYDSYVFKLGDGGLKTGGIWYPFKGLISNVLIFDKTLSAQEILENYKANCKRYGLKCS